MKKRRFIAGVGAFLSLSVAAGFSLAQQNNPLSENLSKINNHYPAEASRYITLKRGIRSGMPKFTKSYLAVVQLKDGSYVAIPRALLQNEYVRNYLGLNSQETSPDGSSNPVKAIDPVNKIHIGRDFALSELQTLNDKAVNDPGYKYEWDIAYTESNKAWSLVKQTREIKVAVLDTGVDYNHPDLKDRVLKDLGYNFVDNNSNVLDTNGHGTHVFGIIAAQANNGTGISGIAGTLDVKIIPVKVLDNNGEGESDIIAKGIRYAVDKGADIINLSFGATGKNSDIESAIEYANSKGVFIVAAAGNDNESCDDYTPAGDDGVYTVSAINSRYKKASFSNYGSKVQGAAPGVQIISTVPNGGYEAWDGTSMAAPVVSGVAAIIKAADPSITNADLASLLDKSAVDIENSGKDDLTGYGLVDAYKALKMLQNK